MEIRIHRLGISAFIGIYPEEKLSKQQLYISVVFYLDFPNDDPSDLRNSVDYSEVSKHIISHMDQSRYGLLEEAAAGLIHLIHQKTDAKNFDLEIEKPFAVKSAENIFLKVSSKEILPL